MKFRKIAFAVASASLGSRTTQPTMHCYIAIPTNEGVIAFDNIIQKFAALQTTFAVHLQRLVTIYLTGPTTKKDTVSP